MFFLKLSELLLSPFKKRGQLEYISMMFLKREYFKTASSEGSSGFS
jgi:hypothetical protein